MTDLDHNATTPLCDEAREAMMGVLEGLCGNPSSVHAAGRRSRAAVDSARDTIAGLLGCPSHEIVFTSGGTESCNLALLGLARKHRTAGRNHLVTVATEHHAVLHPLRWLARREGFEVTELPVDRFGLVDPVQFADALRPGTILASVMFANNETGVIQPVGLLSRHCSERGILFHSDAVQAFGKCPCVGELSSLDAFSVAAHKFHGPPGAGFLRLRSGIAIEAVQLGGYHENNRRAGTENAAAIAGMAAAAVRAMKDEETGEAMARMAALREDLWEGIRLLFPDAVRNTPVSGIIPNTLNVSFPGCDGETLLMGLDLEGVAASSGSACMVGAVQPSHVLLAMGVPEDRARATVRFSLGRGTTGEGISHALAALRSVLSRQVIRT